MKTGREDVKRWTSLKELPPLEVVPETGRECPECGGDGDFWTRDYDGMPDKEECETCHGTGEIKEEK